MANLSATALRTVHMSRTPSRGCRQEGAGVETYGGWKGRVSWAKQRVLDFSVDGLRPTSGRRNFARSAVSRLPSTDHQPASAPLSTFSMPVILRTAGLLVASNVFMTFAWYAHLKNLSDRPWWIAAVISWGIALFEYLLQVPANRMGYGSLSLGQLKIMQEAITLTVFVPFAVLYMRQPLRLDFLWAALCICGAVYFIFRGQ